MPDSPTAILPASHQRARGEVAITWRWRADGATAGVTALADVYQQGSLKARFSRLSGSSPGWAEAILVNSSGGVAGGDVLTTRLALGAGARATVTTQAAERFYRALPEGGPARVCSTVTLGEDAALEWLPQEAILFDGCALRRHLSVQMAGSARFLGIEALVFGRAAHGEQVRRGMIADTISVRRDGRLLWHDATRMHGDLAAMLDRPAVAAGGRAMATLLYVAPVAAARLDAVRAVLRGDSGASAWDGMVVARMVARDAAALRATIVSALESLRAGRPLPRAWNV